MVCAQPLLCDGLEIILGEREDIEIVGRLDMTIDDGLEIETGDPDVVLLAGCELPHPEAALPEHVARVLERYPDLPIVGISLERDSVRVHTTRTLPARASELLALIRSLPVPELGVTPQDRAQRAGPANDSGRGACEGQALGQPHGHDHDAPTIEPVGDGG